MTPSNWSDRALCDPDAEAAVLPPPGRVIPIDRRRAAPLPAADWFVVGRSARMRAIYDFVRVVADGGSSVLIIGETGTGKESIATLIHQASSRRHRPFVAVSCATFSETLIEAELFGHERGAFTGAIKDRAGRFEMAQGGTIFLDDIDDVPLGIQVKLLRVLQTRTIERLGGTRPIPVDVRVVTASKRDLRQMVAAGTFRDDLYYRLNVIPIVLPPLRQRPEDIRPLAEHFLGRAFRHRGLETASFSDASWQAFERYPWPGNVREVENACERIAQTCTCGSIRVGCMPPSVLFHKGPAAEMHVSAPSAAPATVSLNDRLRQLEAELITWALRAADGNKSKAAALLSVKRSTLIDRMRGLNIGSSHPAP